MFIQLIIAILVGIFFGIITGLTPGIHINLVALLLLSASPFLLQYTGLLSLCCFIIAMSITHTFLDSLPSIFLGAPDSEEALGVLPGHRFLLKGQGMIAVKLTLIGSFGALILSIALVPFFIPLTIWVYPLIEDYIAHILIAVAAFMILRDRKKLWAITIFFISGTLGLIVLNIPNFSNPLFPMLSGLFGVSTLLYSFFENESMPEQKKDQSFQLDKWTTVKALLSGQFSGFITAVLPGKGS